MELLTATSSNYLKSYFFKFFKTHYTALASTDKFKSLFTDELKKKLFSNDETEKQHAFTEIFELTKLKPSQINELRDIFKINETLYESKDYLLRCTDCNTGFVAQAQSYVCPNLTTKYNIGYFSELYACLFYKQNRIKGNSTHCNDYCMLCIPNRNLTGIVAIYKEKKALKSQLSARAKLYYKLSEFILGFDNKTKQLLPVESEQIFNAGKEWFPEFSIGQELLRFYLQEYSLEYYDTPNSLDFVCYADEFNNIIILETLLLNTKCITSFKINIIDNCVADLESINMNMEVKSLKNIINIFSKYISNPHVNYKRKLSINKIKTRISNNFNNKYIKSHKIKTRKVSRLLTK